ncbi:ODV-E28, Per os infectivity factor 4 [Perigonia lusca single nucleopolyhedrovirus]|uniref:ODV-E28, Per os infectivity factor 4 n=1 Tax=Perigonia lusca single nucleopolyhedrovirus TaxID=1675865 RepID=A0A0M3WN48_9ABAC|nr:ODV-E28, Per os infectivity factor 4 [Perigonia lusca single nucleopolyhedrovirus]AKN80587.1 ODV-E28, Per os infectivity factor 4 [Perigonia lusca single nucleopolyhedrovirus]
MLSNISSVLIILTAVVCLTMFLISALNLNPYRRHVNNLMQDHANTLQFGAYIDVYDLSVNEYTVERLFLIKPENLVLYNVNGVLFHYLDSSSSVFCPSEFTIVRFSKQDINNINSSGQYVTLCTNVNSLTLLEHFVALKNNIADDRIVLSLDEISFSILDVINLLISLGYVKLD